LFPAREAALCPGSIGHYFAPGVALRNTRPYPTATGRDVQRAMVEDSPHLYERKAGHVDDDTRRTVRKAWEGLGRAPEPCMRAEKDRAGSQLA